MIIVEDIITIFATCKIFSSRYICAWAYGKEKIRGAERNLPDFFGLCPKLLSTGRSDYEKFLLDNIFPTLTEFSQILPDCEANIARLALFAQRTGGGGGGGGCCPPPPPPRPVRPCICVDLKNI